MRKGFLEMVGCRRGKIIAGGMLTLVAVTFADMALEAAQPAAIGGPVVMRRLTQQEYRNSVRDIFGPSIALTARFEPDTRADHLVAIGAGEATVTASAFENYDQMAKGIAAQVMDAERREQFVPCAPADPAAADEKCARQFIGSIGRLLFRRALTETELSTYLKANVEATGLVKDFYSGLRISLAGLLSAPQFLYRQEPTEVDRSGVTRLTGYGMASRLSFLLWNSVPDNQLLDAAEKGDLGNVRGLTRQVDRMLASRRLEEGVRAFFDDMLMFDTFDALDKDAELYPNYTRVAANDAREQTMRTIVDHLLVRDGDYRDLFTTNRTFLTPLLGSIYGVPVETQSGLLNEWTTYEMPADRPAAGILTHASFLMLHSHPGRTSPTLRGKALREIFLCQRVPDPPANVDFSLLDESGSGLRTARERLDAHSANPVCMGCHRITDPIGLALEKYDTASAYRETENGAAIDTTGRLDGMSYSDAGGLGAAIRNNAQLPGCFVRRVYSYAVGRAATKEEQTWLNAEVSGKFSSDKYRVRGLLREIALSPQFFRVAADKH